LSHDRSAIDCRLYASIVIDRIRWTCSPQTHLWRLHTGTQKAAVIPEQKISLQHALQVMEYSALHISCPTTALTPRLMV